MVNVQKILSWKHCFLCKICLLPYYVIPLFTPPDLCSFGVLTLEFTVLLNTVRRRFFRPPLYNGLGNELQLLNFLVIIPMQVADDNF